MGFHRLEYSKKLIFLLEFPQWSSQGKDIGDISPVTITDDDIKFPETPPLDVYLFTDRIRKQFGTSLRLTFFWVNHMHNTGLREDGH